jgi:hypothetical protein
MGDVNTKVNFAKDGVFANDSNFCHNVNFIEGGKFADDDNSAATLPQRVTPT